MLGSDAVNSCAHKATSWRKWPRMGGGRPGFAPQCDFCLARVGEYVDKFDLPAQVDAAQVPMFRPKRGKTGLGGDGNSKRRKRDDFYGSKAWKSQSERVLRRDGRFCQYGLAPCVGKATVAHHEKYHPDGIENTPDEDIVALCKPCHDYHHERLRAGIGG